MTTGINLITAVIARDIRKYTSVKSGIPITSGTDIVVIFKYLENDSAISKCIRYIPKVHELT